MGVDFCATAVVGVRVDKGDVFEFVRKKAFDHDFPEDWAVDPKTGRKLWYEESRCILGEDFMWSGAPNGIQAFTEGMNDDYLYIGLGESTDSHRSSRSGVGSKKVDINLDNLGELKTALQDLLGDVYDESQFGVWAVPYIG